MRSPLWIAAAITAVLGLANAFASNGAWVVAWAGVSLACTAHARLDEMRQRQ